MWKLIWIQHIAARRLSNSALLKSSVFWDIMPFSPLKVNRHFRGTYHLHFQSRIVSQARNQHVAVIRQSSDWYVGNDVFLRNVGWLSTVYMVIYPRTLHCFIGLRSLNFVNKKWFPEVSVFFNVCSSISIGMEPIFDYFIFSIIPLFLSNSKVLTVTSSSERCLFVTAQLQKSTSEATYRTWIQR
jgi:hypothetical protein